MAFHNVFTSLNPVVMKKNFLFGWFFSIMKLQCLGNMLISQLLLRKVSEAEAANLQFSERQYLPLGEGDL